MARDGKPVIGLIGGIGAGKSAVAAECAKLGAAVISGDHLGHEALVVPAIRAAVVGRFGSSILKDPSKETSEGEIDRKLLGALVFADSKALQDLQKIVFPEIERGIEKAIAQAAQEPAVRWVVLDAAILLEAEWNKFCDAIVYLNVPRHQRLARLARQRGWSEKEVLAREQAQWPLKEKAARADVTIENCGPPSAAAAQMAQFLQLRFFAVAP
jgi:dephospho-CoA kinase